jgi:dethiobiotin synthase
MIRFVTGTGLGVGKTVATVVLARRDAGEGRRVAYLKPVQTGVEPRNPGDAGFVGAATGLPAHEALRFTARLDPALAADQAAVTIGFEWLVDLCRGYSGAVDVLYVEGTGGLLSPLSGDRTMADLAQSLNAELIVVTRPGLGTLNHVALTLEAARARALQVQGLVVNRFPAHPGVIEQTNLERLRRIAPVLGLIAELDDIDTTRPPSSPLELDFVTEE